MRDFKDIYGGFIFIFAFPVLGIILSLLLTGCGEHPEPYCAAPDVDYTIGAIVNGEPSTNRRSTVYVENPKGFCSGTIIGPHTVLSAAHCDPVDILVEGVAWFEVTESVRHPDYLFPVHDLILAYTDEVLPGPYAPIGLAEDEACYSLIAQGYGWGSLGELHEREVYETWHGHGTITTGEGICSGDSGGPLYGVQALGVPHLVGVTSWGTSTPNECEGGTNGFTDLNDPANGDWVRENIR